MKNVWNEPEDFFGIILKFIFKWIVLISMSIATIALLVKLFQILFF
jgi:hypothetical protein